ncbi:MAG TPA: GNAT family N-acetyltransferase [Stenomitos sp.]
MQRSPVHLESDRLVLRMGTPPEVPEILRYYRDNQAHLGPFDPARPPDFYTESFWQEQVRRNLHEYRADQSLRLFLFAQKDPTCILGTVNFTAFVRGVSHSCNLGYGLASEAVGKGYLTEVLPVALGFVFDRLAMHRVQANYMPHNERSGALLKRLGFVIEGYARDYLYINGAWRDHLLTSLTNPNWQR